VKVFSEGVHTVLDPPWTRILTAGSVLLTEASWTVEPSPARLELLKASRPLKCSTRLGPVLRLISESILVKVSYTSYSA